MAKIEVKKVEDQLNHRLLFSVRMSGETGPVEFPVGIPDQGAQAANEAAVLTSALAVAEETCFAYAERVYYLLVELLSDALVGADDERFLLERSHGVYRY